MPTVVPLTGGGDGVCGHRWSTMPETKLAMMNFNENARA